MNNYDLFPVFKEHIEFKEEARGAAIIDKKKDDFFFISPFEAYIYSLFDGRRTISDIINILGELKNSPNKEEIYTDIQSLIQNRHEIIEIIEKPLEKSRIQTDPSRFLLAKGDLFNRPARFGAPISAELYLTRRCNLNCIYCFADAKWVGKGIKKHKNCEMSYEEINYIIDQLAEIGVRSVTITGGEATLRPDLPKIISRLSNYGIKILLPTNAYSMSDKIAEKLKNSGLNEVQTKLDAANPETQDRLSQVKGSYTRLIKGIKVLKKCSFNVSTVSVITSLNVREFPQLVELCSCFGVDEVIPRIYTPGLWSLHGRGGAFLNPSLDDLFWLEGEIEGLQEEYQDILRIKTLNSSTLKKNAETEVPICPGFISSFVILENGLVVPCEMMADSSNEFVIGDGAKDKLIDIWNSEKAENWVLRKDLGIGNLCVSCNEFERCKAGCAWKAIVAYGCWLCDPTCIKAPKPTKIPFAEVPVANRS
jgi:radical SAM protein with 4Fe4S-binding SPASM domain